MTNRTTEFFKGRIGQAILETTLLHFGYKVERLGCKIAPIFETKNYEGTDYLPDLLVTKPGDGEKTYLEVKLQRAHPLSVRIPKAQVHMLRQAWPNTLLVFVSAYNGSINCLDINDTVLNDEILDDEGFYRLELLSEVWKPLWEFFPRVEKGEKTDDLWQDLKAVLDDFASNRFSASRNTGFFAEEKDSLKKYIERNWHPGMLDQDIHMLNVDTAGIDEIWEQAISIHAFRFAFDLCGGEENIDHPAFSQVMDKLRGKTGEQLVTIPYQAIKKTLTEYPDLYSKILELEKEVSNSSPYDSAVLLLEGLLKIIPSGLGTAYVRPEQRTKNEPIEVDFRTLLTLIRRSNCLYD